MQAGPNVFATLTPVQGMGGCGAFHRRSPPGGAANAEELPPPPDLTEEEIIASEAKLGTMRHAEFDQNDPATWGRTGRNAPCPCGSGKKYKQCHGNLF